MKKTVFYTCTILLAIGLAACKKSAKGKITREWNVVSYREQTTTGNTVNTFYDIPSKLTIDKDGTWTWNKESKISGTIFGGSIYLTNKKSMTHHGTWTLIGKTAKDRVKKNDLLLFNVLSESTVSSQTGGGGNPIFPDTTVYSSQTYQAGEKVIAYTVISLDKEELRLESKGSYFDASTGETSSKKINVSLKPKK